MNKREIIRIDISESEYRKYCDEFDKTNSHVVLKRGNEFFSYILNKLGWNKIQCILEDSHNDIGIDCVINRYNRDLITIVSLGYNC